MGPPASLTKDLMTPGYAPPAAELQAFKAEPTSKALATCFPHG